VAILLILIAAPPLRHAFGLMPVRFVEWWILILFPPVMLLLEEIRKWVVRQRPRSLGKETA